MVVVLDLKNNSGTFLPNLLSPKYVESSDIAKTELIVGRKKLGVHIASFKLLWVAS
jgi:hypothetical protein